MESLFQIKAGNIKIPNPIALSPMPGITDAKYALEFAKGAGLVIFGPYNLDWVSKEAAEEAVRNGNKEFIFENPLEEIEKEIKNYREKESGAVAVSVRAVTIEKMVEAAKFFKENNVIIELDAFTEQPEFTERGLGQAYFEDKELFREIISKVKKTGVVLSVKYRSSIEPPKDTASFLDEACVDIIHIDAIKPDGGPDFKAVNTVRNTTNKLIIANNSVTDFSVAKKYFTDGANIVSVARGTEDKNLVSELVAATTKREIETGWYNSPSHNCIGGDNRGLVFCCKPVKDCKLPVKLKELNMSPDEYVDMKLNSAKETLLEQGESTCFGSLIWCCKTSKDCEKRDTAIEQLGISKVEYMILKKQMAENISDELYRRRIQAA